MIKLILLISVLMLLVAFLRGRNTMRFRAGKKILFAVFLVAVVASVLVPGMVTSVAQAIGVGRGTDLLLYVLVISFAFVTVNIYLKFKDLDERYTVLVRRIAIEAARGTAVGWSDSSPRPRESPE